MADSVLALNNARAQTRGHGIFGVGSGFRAKPRYPRAQAPKPWVVGRIPSSKPAVLGYSIPQASIVGVYNFGCLRIRKYLGQNSGKIACITMQVFGQKPAVLVKPHPSGAVIPELSYFFKSRKSDGPLRFGLKSGRFFARLGSHLSQVLARFAHFGLGFALSGQNLGKILRIFHLVVPCGMVFISMGT